MSNRFLALTVMVFLPTAALADVPGKLAYQGRLLKADGTPEAGVASMVFTLFDAATGGNALWTETQSVALTEGYYATVLGDTIDLPDSVFSGAERFLEIQVAGTTLVPRQRIVSTPYAMRAGDADTVGGKRGSELGMNASEAIVSAVSVNAKSACAHPAPHLDIWVNGALIAGTDVTNSTFADTAVFPVAPTRYANEVALTFTNGGTCPHNLYIDHITLTTPAGAVALKAADPSHVIFDRGAFFDGVDVATGTDDLAVTGALRFLISPATLMRQLPWSVSLVDLPYIAADAYGTFINSRKSTPLPITINGFSFPTGIITHPLSGGVWGTWTFTLNRQYRTFEAFIGIDDEASASGSANFSITLNGSPKPVLGPILKTFADDPELVSVDVGNADTLTLRVNDGGNSNSSDHAAWGSPRLVGK